MTQESDHPSFRDRSLRLRLFGFLAVGVGAMLGAVALLLPAMALLPHDPGTTTLGGDLHTQLSAMLLYLMLAAAFAGAGIGSVRRRRWVRSVMLVLAWTWLLTGLLGLPLTDRVVRGVLAAGPDAASGVAGAVRLITLMLVATFGVALPAAFVWVYRDRDLQRTCEAHDPGTAWTDRCPPTALGLSLGLAAGAALTLPMAIRPVVPLFGRLITGPTAAGLMLAGGAVCAWAAWETYLLRRRGWWVALALLVLGGVSVAVTFLRVDPAEYYLTQGYTNEQVALLGVGGPTVVWLTTGLTVATVVYMLAILAHYPADRR